MLFLVAVFLAFAECGHPGFAEDGVPAPAKSKSRDGRDDDGEIIDRHDVPLIQVQACGGLGKPPSFEIILHSCGETGWTERRGARASTMSLSFGFALISASGTGLRMSATPPTSAKAPCAG